MESVALECDYCGVQQEVYLAKRSVNLDACGCYCDQDHLDSHLRSQGHSKTHKKIKIVGLPQDTAGAETSLEQVGSPEEAEFIFMLYQLRMIFCTELVRSLLDKDNLSAKYEELRESNPKHLNDLFLLTDIFKFSLGKEMPEKNQAFVVQRIQSIFSEAKQTSNRHSDTALDRQLYMMIVKNTIDTLATLHVRTDQNNQKSIGGSILREGTSNGHTHAVITPETLNALQYVSLDELDLKRKTIVVTEGYYLEHHVQLVSRYPDFRDLNVNQLADILRNDTLAEPNFLLAERVGKVDLIGIESSSIKILEGHVSMKGLLQKEILMVRNFGKMPFYSSRAMVTVDVYFPIGIFGQNMHFVYSLQKADDLELVQEAVNKELLKLFIPGDMTLPPYQLKVRSMTNRIKDLKELLLQPEKYKTYQIIIDFDDIKFQIEREEALYSQSELEFFQAHCQDLRSEKFLTEAAALFSVPTQDLQKTLDKIEDRCSAPLKVGRVLRSLLIADLLRDLDSLHKLSFLFPPQMETGPKESCELIAAYYNKLCANRQYALRRNLELHSEPGKVIASALLQSNKADVLPRILCLTVSHTSISSLKDFFASLLQRTMKVNSRVSYELKSVLQIEYDPRGAAVGVFMKNAAEWTNWISNELLRSSSRWSKSKEVIAIFEQKVAWVSV